MPDELTSYFAAKNEAGLLKKIEGKLEAVSDKIISLPTDTANDVKSFIKNELSGNPIIPGSSLKGAVRSVILDYLIGTQKPTRLDEKDYFGDSNKGDELMRFIKFSDAEFSETTIVNTKIFNLKGSGNNWTGGWKHEFKGGTNDKYKPNGFNTLCEALLPSEKSVCSIMLSKISFGKIVNQNLIHEKQKLFDLKELFQIINNHTKAYLDKEIQFFTQFFTDKTNEIIESLNNIKNQIPNDNSYCVLKMSAGSGFHSITGDWQYDDYVNIGIWSGGRNDGKKKYKSRKIAIHDGVFSLMGFVKLQPISDEELGRRNLEKEAEKQRIANEKQAEQNHLEEEKRIEREYDAKIIEAESFFSKEKYEEALDCFEEAKTLLSDGKKHGEQIVQITNILITKRLKRENAEKIRENATRIENDRIKSNQIPLADKLKSASKIPTTIGNLKTWMKLNEVTNLSDSEIDTLKEYLLDIYNSMKDREKKEWQRIEKWKELSAIIGDNEMVEILSLINKK
ncbi:MAG: RAMP superfamily CRISPR-associated protein [Flavobacteriaceae bacterium]|nr:RAMP superfamily CRISPR-associated protein [Flavobacteriaceae bacterium]